MLRNDVRFVKYITQYLPLQIYDVNQSDIIFTCALEFSIWLINSPVIFPLHRAPDKVSLEDNLEISIFI